MNAPGAEVTNPQPEFPLQDGSELLAHCLISGPPLS
jgi:hypothetical protein